MTYRVIKTDEFIMEAKSTILKMLVQCLIDELTLLFIMLAKKASKSMSKNIRPHNAAYCNYI